MQQVTKAEFLALYEEGMLTEVIYVKDRVIGRSVKGQGNNPKGYEVVYALV